MFADRDYQRNGQELVDETMRPKVSAVNCYDKEYSVVKILCKDRPKLLFDTICTLMDMQYVVFHANADGEGP
ncbi:hypothetical protein IEQ34_009487 [Dendrobium chrysotoxum]|uniref:ACT domain-containing protein ACR n=1 Tax=Dendrobium chrysotoxum TaxID=161865 RepID=A0AAV7H268_DENCH|nr:hypothetical protein IEQ34_009487 [Dendrobium chrysotoxum]